MKKRSSKSVGVIVGRFQVPELHEGHRHLLREVAKRHKRILIAIGCRAGVPTKRDPLDYELRRLMLERFFPGAVIVPIFDQTSNRRWCKRLDELVEESFFGRKAILYGSRDSFVAAYVGKFPTRFVRSVSIVSGTSVRSRVAEKPKDRKTFREGAIYVTENRHPVTYPTVDVAIVDGDTVLLGKKKIDGGKCRFIGGFVDVTDGSLEDAAVREVGEEVKNATVGNFRFLGSSKINDYRYRGSGDGIMTSLFEAQFYLGVPEAGDDIDNGLEWVEIPKLMRKLIPSHRPLGEILMKNRRKEILRRNKELRKARMADPRNQ